MYSHSGLNIPCDTSPLFCPRFGSSFVNNALQSDKTESVNLVSCTKTTFNPYLIRVKPLELEKDHHGNPQQRLEQISFGHMNTHMVLSLSFFFN